MLVTDGCSRLYDSPDVFSGMAELAAGDAGTQAEIADADCVVLEFVREVVFAFRHGSDKHANAFF